MSKYLSLSEAWELIPRFDGDNPEEVSSVIDACKTVKAKIDPAHEQDLLESILNTKIIGTAAVVLKLNGVSTFEELIAQLRKLYPRDLKLRNSCYRNCRYDFNNGFQYPGYQSEYFAHFERTRKGRRCIHSGCWGRNRYLFVWQEQSWD